MRSRHLLFSDLTNPAKVPYHLTPFEQGKTPDVLTNYVMNLLVPNAGTLTLDQWFEVEVLGKPLYHYGLWELLYLVLSSEAFEFVQDAGGYDSNVANANAVATLPPHHGADVSYQTLVGGYDLFPKTLVRQFERWGGTVRLNHRLTSFGASPRGAAMSGRGRRTSTSKPGGRYRLTFRRTATNEFRTRDLTGEGSEQIVHADRIVLAMPRRALELVECEWFSDIGDVRAHIASVLIQPAFKLFLGYEYPWWRQLGLVAGRSITDMPVRQTYYFGTEGEQPGADPPQSELPDDGQPYNDLQSVPFWKGFERDAPFEGHRARFMERRASRFAAIGIRRHTRHGADGAASWCVEIHCQKTLPAPYSALYTRLDRGSVCRGLTQMEARASDSIG